MYRQFSLLLYLLSTILLLSNAFAEDLEAKGYDIAERSDHSDRGFAGSKVKLTMVLHNAADKESSRTLEIQTLDAPNDDVGDKSLVIFDSPRDINGTALLSHAKIIDPDDQWLYLPALKRVKRISSKNKSGPFVGSEFAFEDFTSTELKKYDYKWLRQEACGDFICDVVERYPLYENSGYTRQISWIDQTDFQVRKLDFYDRKNALLKTLRFEDYRKYEDKYWRSHKLSMENHQTGKSTSLIYSDYEFTKDLTDNDFNKGVLKRGR